MITLERHPTEPVVYVNKGGRFLTLRFLHDGSMVINNHTHVPIEANKIVDGLHVIFEDQRKPECFGSKPGPQQQAENDCETCDYNKECLR